MYAAALSLFQLRGAVVYIEGPASNTLLAQESGTCEVLTAPFTPHDAHAPKRGFVVADFVGHQDGRFRLYDLHNMIRSHYFSLRYGPVGRRGR